MIARVLSLSFLVTIALSATAEAHSGRTNSDGCHNDYIHGGYHCHNDGVPSSLLCGNGLSLWLSPLSLGLVGLHSRFRTHTDTPRTRRTS